MTPDRKMYCKLCSVIVNCVKTYTINSHMSTHKHTKKLNSNLENTKMLKLKPEQTFLETTNSCTEFSIKILNAFISADIPIHKLNNKHLKNLFEFMGHPLPSAKTVRNCIDSMFYNEKLRIKDFIKNKPIFIVIDETFNKASKFTSVLVGLLEYPKITYLIKVDFSEYSINAEYISSLLSQTIDEFNI